MTPIRIIRLLLWLAMAITIAACSSEAPPPPAAEPEPEQTQSYDGVIAAVGDSLTAGYGLEETAAYPHLLEQKLQADGYNWQVINAGISGETSSGTLSRLEWIMTLEPDIIILVTGANDGLRGVDPALTRQNLEAIVETLQSKGVTVVLGGMQMVQNLGQEYTRAFAANYPAVADKYNLIFIPFFLEGVAGEPSLNQNDGIHPTAEGYRKVVETVYPYAVEAIQKHQNS